MATPYKKFFSPLVFDLINKKNVKTSDNETEYDLNPGALNGNLNYGFALIFNRDGKNQIEYYGTEERIDAFGIEDGEFKVYEEGKTLPWRFTGDGTLLEEARFLNISRRDQEYYQEHYESSIPEEKIEKVL